MEVQEEIRKGIAVVFIMAGFALFPQPAYAVEAGCFCTFIFVSIMFIIGIAATFIVKYLLSRKIWQLSLARTSVITFIEVVLMMVVLMVLQTKFYFRLLAYIPMAFLLNYAMIAAKGTMVQESRTPKKRAVMAMLSSLVLPVAVQVIGWLAMVLSNMITFKELRV
jgi:hypothetical protein